MAFINTSPSYARGYQGYSATTVPYGNTTTGFYNQNTVAQDKSANPQSLGLSNQAYADTNAQVQDNFAKIYDGNSYAKYDLASSLNDPHHSYFKDFIFGFSLSTNGQPKNIAEYDVEQITKTIAAKYASVEFSIQNSDLSSAEKETMLQQLQKQMNEGLAELEQNYGQAATEFFDKLGQLGAGTNAAQALSEHIKKQVAEFSEFLNSSEGESYIHNYLQNVKGMLSAQVEGLIQVGDSALTIALLMHEAEAMTKAQTKDIASLTKDIVKPEEIRPPVQTLPEVADEDKEEDKKPSDLIDLVKPSTDQKEPAQNDLWSKFPLRDLQMIGSLQRTFSTFITADFNQSEEQFGFEFGLTMIKSLEALKKNQASQDFSKLIQNGLDFLKDQSIKDRNDAINKQPQDIEPRTFNKNTVDTIVNKMRESYESNPNTETRALDSVANGFEIAKTSFDANFMQNADLLRYQSSATFFNTFYNIPRATSFPKQTSYESNNSPYHKHMQRMATR